MKTKLYCLGFAGGSKNSYIRLKPFFKEEIEMIPLEYSGRGRRFSSPLCMTIGAMADDLYSFIQPDDGPYAYLAHSMGTAVTVELLRRTIARKAPLPVNLFLSGRNSPDSVGENPIYHTLEDDEFIKGIEGLGGTNPGVFQNDELRELFLPIMRADFKAIETYQYIPLENPPEIPVAVFYGLQDPLTSLDGVRNWTHITRGPCEFHAFPGEHMHLFENPGPVIEIINRTIKIE